jgi:high-affinity iron transporter
MFGTGLIVFRETLEAAMFVGIVATSTRGVMNRTRWLALGVGAGVLGSLILASAMEQIAAWAEGIGQDLMTTGILSVALIMLAWHCIWVSPHAQETANKAKHLGSSIAVGSNTLWALSVAVALSVLREGAETVLFIAGLLSGENESTGRLLLSAATGLGLGISVGWLVYAGLKKISSKRLFGITNFLILLLAGGLASQLAKTLNQANLLTMLDDEAWDTSAWISNDSAVGAFLHGFTGFDANPTQLQLLFYIGTVVLIIVAARLTRKRVLL